MNRADQNHSIDLVIPWVDGADPAWQAEKVLYTQCNGDDRSIRYRDWDNLKYLFRGIEKNLPWIRKVHFVTWGHLPEWMDINCSKLNIVKHSDYIPKEYLPVFSSHPIELNFHRIEGLAEHFIYANDDMFFLQLMQPSEFFKKGLPVDSAVQNVLQFHRGDGIDHIVANNLICVNRNFNKRDIMCRTPENWFNHKYGKGMLYNMYLFPFKNFTGFVDYHLPYAYLKSTFEEVWEKETEILNMTCHNRIRCSQDVNQWIMRYWQLAKGSFVPGTPNKGRFLVIGQEDDLIERTISECNCAMVCLSDDIFTLDFEKEKAFLIRLFEKIYPKKSAFER